jgi:hypothetical protein
MSEATKLALPFPRRAFRKLADIPKILKLVDTSIPFFGKLRPEAIGLEF